MSMGDGKDFGDNPVYKKLALGDVPMKQEKEVHPFTDFGSRPFSVTCGPQKT